MSGAVVASGICIAMAIYLGLSMRPIHVATSPLTSRIYAGRVLKCGYAWASNKQDVTAAACGAVCEHVIAKGGTVKVTLNGEPAFEITVRDLRAAPAADTN